MGEGVSFRAQPLQFVCRIQSRCLCAPVPANGFVLVFRNTSTATVVQDTDIEQCCRMSLGGSKLVQPQRFMVVLMNAMAFVVHAAQVALRLIKVLCCSEPKQANRLGVILLNAYSTRTKQHAEHALPVSAALP